LLAIQNHFGVNLKNNEKRVGHAIVTATNLTKIT
jgi:hypothetical protein